MVAFRAAGPGAVEFDTAGLGATAFDADGTRTTLLHVLAVLTGAHQALVFIVSAAVAVALIGWVRRVWPTWSARAAD